MRYSFRTMMIAIAAITLASSLAFAGTPGAPSDLTLRIEGKGFLLTWKASPDDPGSVTGYEIERAVLASGPFETIAHVKKAVLKYHDRKANPENIYYYRVKAMAGKEYSTYSNTVTGELPGY